MATGTTESASAKVEKEYGQASETTMSFVLKLDVEAAASSVVENAAKDSVGSEGQSPPTLVFAREIWRSQEPVAVATGTLTSGNAVVIASSDAPVVATNGGKSQLLQSLEAIGSQEQQTAMISTVSALATVKPVVTYPVAKGAREQVQRMIAGSQTNAAEVLTTRTISQKLPPSSTDQAQPVPVTILNTSSQTSANSTSSPSPNGGSVPCPWQATMTTIQSNQPLKNQVADLIHCSKQQQLTTASNVQTTVHHKFQPIYTLGASTTAAKTITAVGTMDLQRYHTKPGSIISTSQSAQKIKAVTNIIASQSAILTQRNNSLSRSQNVQKTRLLTGQNPLMINNQATVNNANQQKIQLGNPAMQKTTQPVNVTNMQKATLQSVCNSQKVPLLSGNHLPNLKTHQQQGAQKLQVPQKMSLTVGRQQFQSSSQQMNNVSKSSGPATGVQKYQLPGQQFIACQQTMIPQRSQSAATGLQKSQTLTTVQATKSQTATSNVSKSNSTPNVCKPSQNSNVLTIGKQQSQVQSTSAQLLPGSQQVIQKTPQQQSANANNLQVQRSHSITNMHPKVIASIPINQRTPVVMNSKVQQQQQQQQQQTVMRVGISKGQAQPAQTLAGLKTVSQKLMNPVKTAANSQNNAIQQPVVQRNSNLPQPVKIIQQQQQQNVISPQNAPQKQPGCIKTIPPQKPVQRNHAQKVSGAGMKPLLSPNVPGFTKAQGPTATQVAPKTSIKTLLPQQPVVAPSNVIVPHKNSPIKIQQQAMQQKQLVMTPQYTQQIRQQAGQIKTLLPITSTTIEPRKDLAENKNDTELRMSKEEEQSTPKSPMRRMPLPYECLQFVLQDHNYGAPPPRTPPPPPSPPPHPKQQPINGAGSSTATPQHPYIFGPVVSNTNVEDDAASAISSEGGREAEPEGEETETAPEGEGDDEDSVTRCICDFEHDDGYMICCDRCLVWQHVDCMGIDRSNIPDEYLCERCRPRRVDRQRARALQMRKREELLNSDSSSDTSSTSSADTDVGSANNPAAAQKKRSLSQQQPQVPRRSKSESAQSSQVRRLNNNNNNNNNNNVGKRQRRDSQARPSSAVRKKENATPKRGPGKRKTKRRTSLEDKEEDVQEAWGTNMAPLRQWIERYEEAVTNHYSPELRARISNIKVNGTHSDLRQSNMNVVAGRCRLNVHSNNLRFLVATMYLPPNSPVVELRGKYMLSTQHRLQYTQSGRQHVQRPGPFVFFYRLPRDGTEVCVDTRTYGNDARFVRRSCKPNAEVKHCIEKGTLHLYIVTTCAIEKNAEITIKHEQHDLLLSPNPNSPALPVACACNNPRECQVASAASQLSRRGSNGALAENADGRERRRRGRRNTVCEETESTPPAVPPTSVAQTVPTATSSASTTVAPATPRRTVATAVTTTTTRQVPKEETTATVTNTSQPQTSPSLTQPVAAPETKKDKKKMTREERKMEAIMKAFERLEKAEQRKQEVQARNAQRKESGGTHSDNEDSHSITGQSKSGKQMNSERPLRRRRRKGRARTTSSSQSQSSSSRRTRLNSAESDVSSGDESNSMQSPPLLSQNRPPSRDIPYSSHLHTPAKSATGGDVGNTGSSSGGHQGIPTAAGLLLALANSNAPGPPSSPPLQQPTPVKSPTCDSGASSSSQSSTPSTPLSSACLLVAAAVGPLAPGFKFPKTKKVLMNEWLKESPDPPQTNIPQVSPLPALPPAGPPTLPNAMNHPLCGRHFPPLPTDGSAEFLSHSYAAKSLATLVQAANSVSGICDSPPQRRQQQQAVAGNNNNNNGSGGCPAVSSGSAKKRWLRQAISEECDSPNSRPESPPTLSETVAPPKKRRIARESLSSDNYTPPTTPTMLLPTEAAPNSRSLCPAEDDYTEHVQSPIVEQTDEKNYESESVKEEIKMDDGPIDSDKPVAQEKLSIDIFPEPEFCIKREGKTECSDIVKTEVSSEMDKEELAAKEEKVSPKWERDDIKSECNYDQMKFDKNLIEKIRETVERVKKECLAEEIVAKGTVEIIDQNEPDTEMEGFSSPIATIEPDAILKQRVVEMQLEFGGGIAEIVNRIVSENEKSNDEEKPSEAAAPCQEIADKSDDNASIDEFDVEAQMKKITGDDGNDYQEKIDTSSEKDKSMDGIEGLMESSKEDSDSEDKDMDDDKYCESSFKLFDISHEEAPFKELDTKPDTKPEQIIVTEDNAKKTDKGTNDEPAKEVSKAEQPSSAFAALSEESIFESASTNMDAEPVADPPKIFHSIPPLSERIRKKPDPSATPKTPKMDFEAAIIESTISMDAVDGSENGEQKSMLSTALRELLEAKLDDEPTAEVMKNDIDSESNASSQVNQPKSDSSEHSLDTVQDSASIQETPKPEETPAKEEDIKPKEIKRLKDPRTVVPNSMPAPAFKTDAIPPVKRKLSISEYRKRKQQSSGGTGTEPESPNDASTADKSGARGRSDSASSGTSSLSSDEEGSKASLSLDLTGANASTLFPSAANENDEKKGGEEGAIGWSAAPTLVERQRENLTERLKREFGLFLSDDEEERARKQGLTAEAILKARKSPPQNLVASTPPGYPGLPQLPPQPYIPPPGSASIHYPQFQSKVPGAVQFNFAVPPPTTSQQPSQAVAVSKQTQQPFLVPQASQAPPGSNPYPPQFAPPSPVPPPATPVTAVQISKFPSATPPPPPPPGTQVSYPPASSGQPQKPFFNHPAPRS